MPIRHNSRRSRRCSATIALPNGWPASRPAVERLQGGEMEELVSPGNAPFLVALCMMAFIGALEGLSLLIGTGLLSHVDAFFSVHLDGGFLGWLHIGRVPLLVLIVLFLMGFAIVGLALQGVVEGLVGAPLPPLLASLIAAAS